MGRRGYDRPGGHYSRHRAVLEKGDMWLGHIIASYQISLNRESLEDDETNHPWQKTILSAVNLYRSPFLAGRFSSTWIEIIQGLAKKGGREFFSERGILLRRGKDI